MLSCEGIFARKKRASGTIPFAIGQTATAITIDGTIDAAWNGAASYIAVDPTKNKKLFSSRYFC
jgi:hypothetical protein